MGYSSPIKTNLNFNQLKKKINFIKKNLTQYPIPLHIIKKIGDLIFRIIILKS